MPDGPSLPLWHRRLPPVCSNQFNPYIALVILLLPISTALVVWTLSTLPISVSWPRNLFDLAQLGRELQDYSRSGTWPLIHVALVMSLSAVWKHAWSIPGSVFWVSRWNDFNIVCLLFIVSQNVLAGALFSPFPATIMFATLTMLGSTCATLLSKPLGPFLAHLSPGAIQMTRVALSGSDHDFPESELRPKASASAWVRLSVLRLVGVVPWSGINIACGVCDVSLAHCMLGAFIGCLPWTAVTCQVCFHPICVHSRYSSPLVDWRYSTDCGVFTVTDSTECAVAHHHSGHSVQACVINGDIIGTYSRPI